MKEPNIFDYATSELSQDAFFAWFFKWAEKKYLKIDKSLHNCAENALKNIIKKANANYSIKSDINSVEVYKQTDHIDLCLFVNEDIYVIIEDKVETKEHDNQLHNYKKIYKKEKNACFAYIKTGRIKADEKKNVEKAGYTIFDIQWLNEQFKGVTTENSIFNGYKEKIKTRVTVNFLLDELKSPFNNKICCWSTNCLYIWFKKDYSLEHQNYFALDMWINHSGNTINIDFYIHIKTKKNVWYEKPIKNILSQELPIVYKYLSKKKFSEDSTCYYLSKSVKNETEAKKYIENFLTGLYRCKNA